MKFLGDQERSDPVIQKQIIDEIHVFLDVVFQHNGFVAGEYIRHVLVPRKHSNNVRLTTLHLYFHTDDEMLDFLENQKERLVKYEDCFALIGKYNMGLIKVSCQHKADLEINFNFDRLVYDKHEFKYIDNDNKLQYCASEINMIEGAIIGRWATIESNYCEYIIRTEQCVKLEQLLSEGYEVKVGNNYLRGSYDDPYAVFMEKFKDNKIVERTVTTKDLIVQKLREVLELLK